MRGRKEAIKSLCPMPGEQSGSEDIRGSAQASGLILRAGGSPGRVLSRCWCDQVSVLEKLRGRNETVAMGRRGLLQFLQLIQVRNGKG